MHSYARKGFLTQNKANKVKQISLVWQDLQAQKIQLDNDLCNEMIKHLAKMIVRRTY